MSKELKYKIETVNANNVSCRCCGKPLKRDVDTVVWFEANRENCFICPNCIHEVSKQLMIRGN